jgi:hypothetical protein
MLKPISSSAHLKIPSNKTQYGYYFVLVLHHPKVLLQSAKRGKKRKKMHNTKYIGLYIYHAFALKKNTNNNNNKHQQSSTIKRNL